MRIRFTGARPREIVGYGIFSPGEEFDAGESTAMSLCDQGWAEPVSAKDKKRIDSMLSAESSTPDIPQQYGSEGVSA